MDEVVRRKGIHVQLWLEGEDGEGFGRGRVELLQLVDELGSLSKAAKQLGMSYRGAWGKIKKAERIAGETLGRRFGDQARRLLADSGGAGAGSAFSAMVCGCRKFCQETCGSLV